MTAALIVLHFLIYRTDDDHAAEAGIVIMRSCAEAEAWVRAGLQQGQAVMIGECRPYNSAEVASR